MVVAGAGGAGRDQPMVASWGSAMGFQVRETKGAVTPVWQLCEPQDASVVKRSIDSSPLGPNWAQSSANLEERRFANCS